MKYSEFKIAFESFPVFSTQDIRKLFPTFDSRRLVEWQKQGYLQKIRRGYYTFSAIIKNESALYLIANKLYSPSYISLESALARHGLIPEMSFTITSITTKNTSGYDTPIGHFQFRHLKAHLYFGYSLDSSREKAFRIAEPEKAILDYLYLSTINDYSAMVQIRFNKFQIKEGINMEKLHKYQLLFNSRILDKRVRLLAKFIDA